MAHVINGIFHFTYHVQHTCGVCVTCVGPSWAVHPCTSAESPSYHAVSCNMQTGSFVSPLHFQLTKCYQAQICICSVLKDGRAFLGTLALDSNCIVWCTCCVVFTLCALKLHIHPVDDCSGLAHPFYTIAGSMVCVCSNLAHMQWHDLPALRRRPAARLLIVVPCSLLSHPCSWYYTPSCSRMYCYPVLIGCSRPTVYGCTG